LRWPVPRRRPAEQIPAKRPLTARYWGDLLTEGKRADRAGDKQSDDDGRDNQQAGIESPADSGDEGNG